MPLTKTCLNCPTTFEARPIDVQRGHAKFCSRSCFHSHMHKQRKPKPPNLTCAYCQAPFYRNATKRRKSKSGLFFCCKNHKDLASRLSFGLTKIQPSHYGLGNGIYAYRRNAIEHYGAACQNCNYNKIVEVLEVHHIDRDRTNNTLTNLRVLCPTCHDETHFLSKTGKWNPIGRNQTVMAPEGIEPPTPASSGQRSTR